MKGWLSDPRLHMVALALVVFVAWGVVEKSWRKMPWTESDDFDHAVILKIVPHSSPPDERSLSLMNR